MKVDGVIDANPVASAKQASAVEAAGYDAFGWLVIHLVSMGGSRTGARRVDAFQSDPRLHLRVPLPSPCSARLSFDRRRARARRQQARAS